MLDSPAHLRYGYLVGEGFGESQSLAYAIALAKRAPARVVWVVRSPSRWSVDRASEAGLVVSDDPSTDSVLAHLRKGRVGGGVPTPDAVRACVCERIGRRLKLTDREQDIVRLLLEGGDATDISEALHISERTVHVHLGRILRKARMPKTQLFVVRALHEALELQWEEFRGSIGQETDA